MAQGKQTCRILKEIRRQIAEANDIEFVTSECRYKGDCLGTCPKCEAELRYLEQQLRARSLAGKAVAIAGISAGMVFMTGCGSSSSARPSETLQGEPGTPVEQTETIDTIETAVQTAAEDTTSQSKPEIKPDKKQRDNKDSIYIIDARKFNDVVVVGYVDEENDSCTANEKPEKIERQKAEEVKRQQFNESDNYTLVGGIEDYPRFPGGVEKLLEWVSQHIVYPRSAVDAKIEGRVLVAFTANKDGSVGNVRIEEGVDSALDAEAIRVVKSLPKFIPGENKFNGETIGHDFHFPITFKLKKD